MRGGVKRSLCSCLPPSLIALSTPRPTPLSGKLKQLRELNVSYNRLTRVPPELGDCENLEKLELTGNHLAQLPFEVSPAARPHPRGGGAM